MRHSTILIIDDNEDEILLTKAVLSRIERNIRTEAAFGGEEGLSLLRSRKPLPAVILLDLKMPVMDGFEVLRRIRAEESTVHLPVVVVTNSDLDSDRQAAMDAGAHDFLQKSYDLSRFKNDLERVLKRWIDSDRKGAM